MSKVLVIGAGGVSSVAVHKMAMNADIFSHITLASRTKSKCDAIAQSVKSRFGVDIDTAAIDADHRHPGNTGKCINIDADTLPLGHILLGHADDHAVWLGGNLQRQVEPAGRGRCVHEDHDDIRALVCRAVNEHLLGKGLIRAHGLK